MTIKRTIQAEDIPNKLQPECCSRLLIEVEVIADCEDDAYGEVSCITNLETGEFLELEQLSPRDCKTVERIADEAAYENAHEAYYEAQQAKGEAAYDAWKEGD